VLKPVLKSSDSAGFDARELPPHLGHRTHYRDDRHPSASPASQDRVRGKSAIQRKAALSAPSAVPGAVRNPTAFRVQADPFDHEIEFIGAVDLARYAVGHPWAG